ncbi:MAG: YdiU family protein [Pseudonocardiales bacterium]|nr:YdiU family protein [Pseudonocardiales bacterium]
MSVVVGSLLELDHSYARELPGLSVPWTAALVPAPALLMQNEELATELGADPEALREPDGVALLVGNAVPDGVRPVAQAYAGHQFGGYVPRLGDGRALLLGELIDGRGRRRDLHLKGSGRTPFARGGDGKAAVGPMLREYVIGEAMHALGIPTSRALAVVATGEQVARETMLPGAVLARLAASHLRIGTFQYAANSGDPALVRTLADYAIARHHPDAAEAQNPYLEFYQRVIDVQASLVARWMLIGFVHGVMNTDNMTISGESIDYGPCAFMDHFDPATVFSSIDHGGRYAYGNQPGIAQWNLAQLGETLLPLIDENTDAAVEAAADAVSSFAELYEHYWTTGMATKLGLDTPDRLLIQDLLALLHTQRVDFTQFFRALSSHLRGHPARSLFTEPEAFDTWVARWQALLPRDRDAVAAAMNQVNPVYVPRNHRVEEALTAATNGDIAPFRRLVDVISHPFTQRPGLEDYAQPAPTSCGPYVTYCGT